MSVFRGVMPMRLSLFRRIQLLAAVGSAALLLAPPAAAGFAEEAQKTLPKFNVRYRLETVDQDGFDRNARASTAKLRGSWIMDPEEGLALGVEVDHVLRLGSENYHSLENGRAQYPIVADPTGTDLNQAFLRFRSGATTLTAGRQRILHGEQRFVGGVAWRQNEQAYDGVRLQSARGRATFDYSYVWKVRRIFGPDDGLQPAEWDADAHFLRATYSPVDGQALTAFSYLLDFENDNGPANSNASYGLAYEGKFGPVDIAARIAWQRDWGDNPVSYDAPYYFTEAKWRFGEATLGIGHEVLGSDGGELPFRTPLGTLHKFQGWTDKFLATPAAGVKDTYLTVTGSVGAMDLTAAFHQFSAAKGNGDYGREVGVSAVWKLGQLGLQVKLAHYNADGLATDTSKAWFVVSYAF